MEEYSKLEPEGDLESPPDRRPPADWPSQGNIEFRNLSMSYYSDEKPVLNNLNFKIQAGEKIGTFRNIKKSKKQPFSIIIAN